MAVPDEAAVGDGLPPVAMKESAWTKEEDAVLREQVRLHGPQNWAATGEALGAGRNPKSCRLRWCQHLSPTVDTARPFSPQEDERVVALYRLYPNKWATIAGFLPGRTDNAVKNRWHSVLGKVYHHQQRRRRMAAPIHRLRLPDGTLALFPLAPGDVGRGGIIIPVPLRHPPTGVDLSGECLKLFPLVAGDLVRGNNAGEAAAMDVDCSTDGSLVELRLWPSKIHDGGVQGDGAGSLGALDSLVSVSP